MTTPDKERDFIKLFNRDLSKKGTVDINDLDPNMSALARFLYDGIPDENGNKKYVLKGDLIDMIKEFFEREGLDVSKVHPSLVWTACKEMENPADKAIRRAFHGVRKDNPTYAEFKAYMYKLLNTETKIEEL